MEWITKRPQELKGIKPIKKAYDRDYLYQVYELYKINDTLYISCSSHGGTGLKKKWVIVESYKDYYAHMLIKKLIKEEEYLPPRHLNDLLLGFYHGEGLGLYDFDNLDGWIMPMGGIE